MNKAVRLLGLALLLSAAFSACQMRTARPPISTLEIKADIDTLWAQYAYASDKRDAEALGALFTEDATLAYSGAPTARGRPAIQKYLASLYADRDATGLRIVPDETLAYGGITVQNGEYEERFIHKDKSMVEMGRYTLVVRMGSEYAWKILRLAAIVDSTIAWP